MIKGLSETRRLDRVGIIRLGVKVKTKKPCKCNGKDESCRVCHGDGFIHRPKETEYFVCPPEVREKYGDKPTALKVMIPTEYVEAYFPQYYKRYGNGILLCKGDGVVGTETDFKTGGRNAIDCPCHRLDVGECKAIGVFQFILRDPDGRLPISLPVYQISTGSKNSIIDINSAVDVVRKMIGKADFIPLILSREKRETQKVGDGGIVKGTHWTLHLRLDETDLLAMKRFVESFERPIRAVLPVPDESEEAVDDLLNGDRILPPGTYTPEELKEKIEEKSPDLTDPKVSPFSGDPATTSHPDAGETESPLSIENERGNFLKILDRYRKARGLTPANYEDEIKKWGLEEIKKASEYYEGKTAELEAGVKKRG